MKGFNSIIIRYGEISLKGRNRFIFENRLVENIRNCLNKNKVKFDKIEKPRGRIIVKTNEKCDELRKVFGIVSFSYAIETKDTLEDVNKAVESFVENFDEKIKFRVTGHRIDKRSKLRTDIIQKEIGAFIVEKTNAKVDLKNYDQEISVEILTGNAFIFDEKINAYGGLPVGVEGTVVCYVENEKDALACWLVMRRGCEAVVVGEKKPSLLEKYSYGSEIKFIEGKKPEVFKIMQEEQAKAVVFGDTYDDIAKIEEEETVLRPLFGWDAKDINKKLEEIK